MTKFSVPSSRQCCATCQFWTGKKEITRNGRSVDGDFNEHAQCTAGKGTNLGFGTGASCKSYRRWIELP